MTQNKNRSIKKTAMRRLLVIGHHLKASQWQLSSRSAATAGGAAAAGVAATAAATAAAAAAAPAVTPPERDVVEILNNCGKGPRGHVLKQGSGDDDDGSSSSGDIRVALYSGVEVAVADRTAVRSLGPEDKAWFTPSYSSLSSSYQSSTPKLDSMLASVDDSLVRELSIDPHSEQCMPNKKTRQVFSGHYVRAERKRNERGCTVCV